MARNGYPYPTARPNTLSDRANLPYLPLRGSDTGKIQDHSFKASSTQDQQMANALLLRYGLDVVSLNDLKARWSKRWSWSSKGSKANKRYERILYQWCVPLLFNDWVEWKQTVFSFCLPVNADMPRQRRVLRRGMSPYHSPNVLAMLRLRECYRRGISFVFEGS